MKLICRNSYRLLTSGALFILCVSLSSQASVLSMQAGADTSYSITKEELVGQNVYAPLGTVVEGNPPVNNILELNEPYDRFQLLFQVGTDCTEISLIPIYPPGNAIWSLIGVSKGNGVCEFIHETIQYEDIDSLILETTANDVVIYGSPDNTGTLYTRLNDNYTSDGWAYAVCNEDCGDILRSTQIIYEESFDSSPEWITDQPSNFFWKPDTNTYFARTYSGDTDYAPNRFAYVPINLDSAESFTLLWDQKLIQFSGNSVSHFGVMADDLLVEKVSYIALPPITPKSTFVLGLGRSESGTNHYEFNAITTDGTRDGQGGSGGVAYETGVWYENVIRFDAQLRELHWLITDKQTGTVLVSITREMTGDGFSPDMNFLGVGNNPIGYNPNTLYGEDPSDFAEIEIDNIQVFQEASFSLLFPLENLDAYTANISSVFDHSNPLSYVKDGVVKAYNGEIGTCDKGIKEYNIKSRIEVILSGKKKENTCKRLKSESIKKNGKLYSYMNSTDGPTSYPPYEQYLSYDGHPGYDYPAPRGTQILAADGGILCLVTSRTADDGSGEWRDGSKCPFGFDDINDSDKDGWAKWHTFYILHNTPEGYSTWYLHADSIDNTLASEIAAQGYANVTRGEPVAAVGDYQDVGIHLHFEVRKGQTQDQLELVDPYGWESQPALWE